MYSLAACQQYLSGWKLWKESSCFGHSNEHSGYIKCGQILINFQHIDLSITTLGTKCNSLTQQFIGISTTIDTWATCFDSYRVIFRPSKNTDSIYKVVKCKHWGSHSALDYLVNWICILWGPEDDSIRVETCSTCIYGCRYSNKLLC